MQVVVNGEMHEVDASSSVRDLLDALDVNVRHVAVEVNSELVPRAAHADRRLAPGDRLEVVTLVGGG